jgi:tetratricopeptide (TPR) repeat protein/cbb3-type cytochrome oxidase subunit 3
MKIAHEIIRTMAESWLAVFFVIVVVIAVVVYWRSRKQILFEAWVNMYDSSDDNLGRSVADLLLFKIGHIKNVHQRSAGPIGNWNIYRDVPAFQQSLDEDVKLLASVDVGKYGSFVNALSTLLFRLLPMVFRPARLKGSIHKYGDRLQLLATLNFYTPAKWRVSATNLWEVVQEKSSPELLPEAVEELAFRIYLDLTREELFKSWEGFQAYTNGLASYISYVNLQRDADYEKAKSGYERALSLEPNNPAISYSLGVLEYYQWKATDNDEAIGHFVKAVASSQSSLRSYAHSGLANAQAQKYHRYNVHDLRLLEDAVYHGERAVEIDPDLDMSNRALAFACHQLSEYQAASPDAAVRKLSAGNRDRAIQHYVRTYELNAQNYAAHNNLANLYLEWGKREQSKSKTVSENSLRMAIRECEATLAINPQYHLGYDNLANTYYELGQMDKAAENYKNALRYKPDYPEGMNDLGALCMDKAYSSRNVAEALHNHQEALALLPESELQRKKKLCAFFGQRWLANVAQPETQIAAPIRQKLQESLCTCVVKMQDQAAPVRSGA